MNENTYDLVAQRSRAKLQPPVEQYSAQILPWVAANLGLTIQLT